MFWRSRPSSPDLPFYGLIHLDSLVSDTFNWDYLNCTFVISYLRDQTFYYPLQGLPTNPAWLWNSFPTLNAFLAVNISNTYFSSRLSLRSTTQQITAATTSPNFSKSFRPWPPFYGQVLSRHQILETYLPKLWRGKPFFYELPLHRAGRDEQWKFVTSWRWKNEKKGKRGETTHIAAVNKHQNFLSVSWLRIPVTSICILGCMFI